MFKNYLTIAMRNLIKYKGYSLINILGLAVGMACSILIIMYIRYESNYDHFYTNAGCIYRVVDGTNARTGAELGPHMSQVFPEVLKFARRQPPSGTWMMQYGDQIFYEHLAYRVNRDFLDVFAFPFVQGDPGTALREPRSSAPARSVCARCWVHQCRIS